MTGVLSLETDCPVIEVALGWNRRERFPLNRVQNDSEYATLTINWFEGQPLTVELRFFPDRESAADYWRRTKPETRQSSIWLMNFDMMQYAVQHAPSLAPYTLLSLNASTGIDRPIGFETFEEFTPAFARYATLEVERVAITPPVMAIDLLLRRPGRFPKDGEISAWNWQLGREHIHRCSRHHEDEMQLIAVA